MTDFIETQAGTGGPKVATDRILGIDHAITKVGFGVDGAYTPVSPADPMPVGVDAIGARADAAATTDGDPASLIALIKRLLGKLPGVGQAAMAASQPVAIASDQSNLPVLTRGLTATGALAALNAVVSLNVQGLSGVTIDVRGTFAGTVTFQGTVDGTNWTNINVASIGSGLNFTLIATTTAVGTWYMPCSGFVQVRAIMTAYTSGSANVTLVGVTVPGLVLTLPAGSQTVNASGAAAEDAAASGNPIMAAGVARTANAPTTFAAGDVVRHTMTSGGALVVKQYAPQQVEFSPSLALTTTTATAIAAAAAAGIRNHLTSFWAINTGASAVDLIILDGVTERARYPLPPNVPVAVTFPTGLVTTAATALNANLSAAGTVRANFTGYTSA